MRFIRLRCPRFAMLRNILIVATTCFHLPQVGRFTTRYSFKTSEQFKVSLTGCKVLDFGSMLTLELGPIVSTLADDCRGGRPSWFHGVTSHEKLLLRRGLLWSIAMCAELVTTLLGTFHSMWTVFLFPSLLQLLIWGAWTCPVFSWPFPFPEPFENPLWLPLCGSLICQIFLLFYLKRSVARLEDVRCEGRLAVLLSICSAADTGFPFLGCAPGNEFTTVASPLKSSCPFMDFHTGAEVPTNWVEAAEWCRQPAYSNWTYASLWQTSNVWETSVDRIWVFWSDIGVCVYVCVCVKYRVM